MFKAIWHLEKRTLINNINATPNSKRIPWIILIGLALIFLPFMLMSIIPFTINASNPNLDGLLIIISLALFIVSIPLTLKQILQNIFMDDSLKLLFTFPIQPKVLFIIRLIKVYLFSPGVLSFILSIFFGVLLFIKHGHFIYSINAFIWFNNVYLVVFIAMVAVSFLFVKIFPAQFVIGLVSVLSGATYFATYFSFIFGVNHLRSILEYFANFELFAGLMYEFTLLKVILNIAILIVCLGVIFVIIQVSNTISILEVIQSNRKVSEKRSFTLSSSSMLKQLLYKDLRMTFRNIKEIASQMYLYIIPLFIFVMFIFQNDDGTGVNYDSHLISMSIGGIMFLTILTSANNIARDAEHFNMLKTLPIKIRQLVTAKFLYCYIVTVPVYLLIIIVCGFVFDISTLSVLFSMLFICIAPFVTIPLGMNLGSKDPVINKKNPTQRIDTANAFIMMIIIFPIIFSTAILSFFISSGDGINLIIVSILLGFILLLGFVSMWQLKVVANRYEEGFNITIKG